MNIDQLTSQFKSFDELKIFCESQFKQILQLSKKNKELEDKLADSNKKVKEINKVEASNLSVPTLAPGMKLLDDAKTISQIQLKMLKDLSFERELTLEEAKRVEIFNKILNDEKEDKKKPLKADAKVLQESELLKLVDGK